MQLAQSRFAALRGGESRTLKFADMAKGDDPSRIDEQLVVTIDGQLFYSVLSALPYLVNYPYECTEQTLNRFLSTGIVSSVFRDYPAVAAMAQELSKRDTQLETWDAADPNRRMALEETPWLEEARGGKTGPDLTRVLDPRIAKADRDSAIAKLRKAQTESGGFPWWPGGPPSPYMTLYILNGFAHALEFGVEVPRDMVERAWKYAGSDLRRDLDSCMAHKGTCEFVTFVNYVALLLSRRGLVWRRLRRRVPEDAPGLLVPALEGALAVPEGPARPDAQAHGPPEGREARVGLASWTRRRRTRTSARTSLPKTGPGSGTTTRSRRRPSRCVSSPSSSPRTPGDTASSSGSFSTRS